MNTMYSLDIITVCYNAKAALQLTIESVKRVSAEIPVRWIVVDGCSEDGSVELVRDSGIQNLVHVVETDGGIYSAMNKGLSLVESDYFVLLNAGDVIEGVGIGLVDDKVNCFDSAWHDDDGQKISSGRNQIIPWLGIMPNHQGMWFPKRYAQYGYNDSLRISSDLGIKLLAWKNGDMVMRNEVLVSSLIGGASQTRLTLPGYLLRIKENYVASKAVLPFASVLVALSTALRGLKRLKVI